MYLKFLCPIHSFEVREALQGNFRCARDELEELGEIFFVKRAECAPEPLNLERQRAQSKQEAYRVVSYLQRVRSVFVILRIALEIFDVNVRQT